MSAFFVRWSFPLRTLKEWPYSEFKLSPAMRPDDSLKFLHRAVSATQPDRFGRCAEQETQVMEVRIFGHDGKPAFLRMIPDGTVTRSGQNK